jgi:hypothetical protein
MGLYPEIPLVALLGVVHLRIPLTCFVFGGTVRCVQTGIDDQSLSPRHAPCIEMGFDALKDLLAQLVLHQQVVDGVDRVLIWDPVT